jgi:hypothetical protein
MDVKWSEPLLCDKHDDARSYTLFTTKEKNGRTFIKMK